MKEKRKRNWPGNKWEYLNTICKFPSCFLKEVLEAELNTKLLLKMTISMVQFLKTVKIHYSSQIHML